jgi:hypothetical protein
MGRGDVSAPADGWARLLEASASRLLDPYLLWAIATDFRDYAGVRETGRVPVALEAEQDCQTLADCLRAGALPGVALSTLYTQGDGALEPKDLRHATALVERDALIEAMLSPLIRRMELGAPLAGAQPADQTAAADVAVPRAEGEEPPWRPEVVIGIVDDFVAFDHPRLRAPDGSSRVRYVWSQDAVPPRAIDASLWKPCGAGGHELCTREAAMIRPLADAYPAVLRRATHGTHVADVAAGGSTEEIIAVHLPPRAVTDSSGGAMNVQMLDAIRYIVRRAGPQARVVVNISYATTAGPHDGSSILESAIEELLSRRGEDHLAIVVPAGNAREARGHAQFTLDAKCPRQTLQWLIAPDDRTPTFMEIWLPEGAAERIRVRLCSPSGVSSPPLQAPALCVDRLEAGFAAFFLPRVANGERGTMILLAVSATHGSSGGGTPAAAGIWTVELSHDGSGASDVVHAWIERDDTVQAQGTRGRQSVFVDPHYARPGQVPRPPEDDPSAYVKRRGAFNTIATGTHTIVVGAHVKHSVDGRVQAASEYSGSGPTRGARVGPDLTATADDSTILHGVRAAATHGVDTVRMNGTSVAVPRATRVVAGLFRDPAVLAGESVKERLRRLLQRPKGPVRDRERDGDGALPDDPMPIV